MIIFEVNISAFCFSLDTISIHCKAESALWSNCPGKNSTAKYFLPFKSSSVVIVSVTGSDNIIFLIFSTSSLSSLRLKIS